jgi:hypothetical protein
MSSIFNAINEWIRNKRDLRHEWPLKDAIDKGYDGGDTADTEQATFDIEGRFV